MGRGKIAELLEKLEIAKKENDTISIRVINAVIKKLKQDGEKAPVQPKKPRKKSK